MFCLELQQKDGFKLNVWDIGGQEAIRSYWNQYYKDTSAIIYVVDSSDDMRIEECKKELLNLLKEDDL